MLLAARPILLESAMSFLLAEVVQSARAIAREGSQQGWR
jgi:hypothetical protein